MIQANLNNVPQDTLTKLALLSQKKGLSVEAYHEQILTFWVEFASYWESSQNKLFSKKQQSVPNF